MTTGEILIKNYSVEGTGDQRTITADLEWTFPLYFVEVVWGDGKKIDRQIIPATDLRRSARKHFAIPFDATGKAWVRFAVWDSAGNGLRSAGVGNSAGSDADGWSGQVACSTSAAPAFTSPVPRTNPTGLQCRNRPSWGVHTRHFFTAVSFGVVSITRSLIMTTIRKSGKASQPRWWLTFRVFALMSLAGVSAAFAQSVSSGTIEGTVKDESNAVLPGVTVTVTSPQLQVGQLVQVSDSQEATSSSTCRPAPIA